MSTPPPTPSTTPPPRPDEDGSPALLLGLVLMFGLPVVVFTLAFKGSSPRSSRPWSSSMFS